MPEKSTECQHYASCGCFCETPQEISHNLCENCLEDHNDDLLSQKIMTTGLSDRLAMAAKLISALADEVRLAGSDFHADSLEFASKTCTHASKASFCPGKESS